MKKILKRFWLEIKRFIASFWYGIIALILAIISYYIWDIVVAAYVGFGIVGSVILFIWLRQLWWYITKTGDYENKN